jgi:signal transduction histidine kinase
MRSHLFEVAVGASRAKWTTSTWVMLVFLALVPVALLGVSSFAFTSHSVRQQVEQSNEAAATVAAELVEDHFEGSQHLASAVAALPEMIEAVRRHDADAVSARLGPVVDAHRDTIQRAYLLDRGGILWADYPHSLGSLGSVMPPYVYLAETRRPAISDVFQNDDWPRRPAVAVGAPVVDSGGEIIGVVAFQYRLDEIMDWLKRTNTGTRELFVLDQNGTVIAHPRLDLQARRYKDFASLDPVREALKGMASLAEYDEPRGGQRMIASFHPVKLGGGNWVLVAQQPVAQAYAPIYGLRRRITISGIIVGLAALASALMLGRSGARIRRLSHERANLLDKEQAARAQAEAAGNSERAAHEALKHAQSRMLETEKLRGLGMVVAGVAHEINNPLAFAINNLAVLQRDCAKLAGIVRRYQRMDELAAVADGPAEALRQWCLAAGDVGAESHSIDLPYTLAGLDDLIVRSGEGLRRIQKIVLDLRGFSGEEAAEEVQENSNLNSGVEVALNIVSGRAASKGIILAAELTPLPGISCRAARINQVILNLLLNAIDASHEGGIVRARSRPVPAGVELQVIDAGTGIAPEVRPRIFDPFFTTKPPGQGTGLGLSVSYAIVAQQGGRIDVESEVGRGSCFTVTLPLTPMPQGAAVP